MSALPSKALSFILLILAIVLPYCLATFVGGHGHEGHHRGRHGRGGHHVGRHGRHGPHGHGRHHVGRHGPHGHGGHHVGRHGNGGHHVGRGGHAHHAAGRRSVHHAIGRHPHHDPVVRKINKPRFKPGPWKQAHATFYEGGSGTFGGACNFKDVVAEGYGTNTAAVSSVMFNSGQACGACYEIKCTNDAQWCKLGSLFVTATDLCPPNPSLSSDNGGWCNPPLEHFDIAKPAFSTLADYTAGIVPVQFRRVPCQKKGGIRFTINGNPWFYQVIVWNVGSAGDVVSVQVKGNDKVKWTQMQRDWGATWKTSVPLVGESLTFRVGASDGRYSTSWHVAPPNWQFGQTYEGKNFR